MTSSKTSGLITSCIWQAARAEFDQHATPDFISRELGWLGKQIAVINRVLDPSVQQQAFGARGEPGTAVRIEHVARHIIKTYESMLDWAATLRNTSVPDVFAEVLENVACMVDRPLLQMREFIQTAADQISRLPELAADGTEDQPVTIKLELIVTIDEVVQERLHEAIQQAKQETKQSD